MEQELTVEELIALVNSQKGDFIIRIEFGEEADWIVNTFSDKFF